MTDMWTDILARLEANDIIVTLSFGMKVEQGNGQHLLQVKAAADSFGLRGWAAFDDGWIIGRIQGKPHGAEGFRRWLSEVGPAGADIRDLLLDACLTTTFDRPPCFLLVRLPADL